MDRRILRRLLTPLVALAVAAAAPVAAQPAPYTINAILSLTGPAANLGQDEAAGLARDHAHRRDRHHRRVGPG